MHEGREVSSLFLNVLVIRIYENGKYLNVSQPQNNNNDAKYTVIEMTWSENLKSCRGQVTDSLSSESHFLTLSLPKTIFIGTDTHQSSVIATNDHLLNICCWCPATPDPPPDHISRYLHISDNLPNMKVILMKIRL